MTGVVGASVHVEQATHLGKTSVKLSITTMA